MRGKENRTMTIKQTEIARKLQRNGTEAERVLWSRLRNRQLHGMTFSRQTPPFGFCADFFCEDAKFVIKLDGGQHSELAKSDRGHLQIGWRICWK